MQIALDTVVYILLSLMLFSLVLSFLPNVEQLGYSFSKGNIRISKEEAINQIIDIYLGKESSKTLLLKDQISSSYIRNELNSSGLNLSNFEFNFNSSSTLSIMKSDGKVIING